MTNENISLKILSAIHPPHPINYLLCRRKITGSHSGAINWVNFKTKSLKKCKKA